MNPLAPPAPIPSVPARLLRQAHERGSRVALRDKRLGRWRETTWAQLAQRAAQVGVALAELGIGPGERVAIRARNRLEWVIADLAIQGIGCVSVGVPPTGAPAEVEYLLSHSGACVLIAEDEGQLEKCLAMRARLPELQRFLVMDAEGIQRRADPEVTSLSELERTVPARSALEDWASHVEGLDPSSIATIVYTTRSTGRPKGAMLTHANLAWAAATLRAALGARPDDEILADLPLCQIAARITSMAVGIDSGAAVHFGEGGASLPQDLLDVRPTIFIARPPAWERMSAEVKSTRRTMRKKLGLSRIRVALSAGTETSPEVLDRFGGLGIEVRDLYSPTEATSVCTLSPPGENRAGTVGRALAGVEVRIVADDEILLRSPGVFSGYFNDEAATEEAIDATGWLHTGDRGMFDVDGFLTLAAR